jgi:hypothetical protein
LASEAAFLMSRCIDAALTKYMQYSPFVFLLQVRTKNCNENPIYVFPEKELRGLSPNFRRHVFVSYLYIPRIGQHIFLRAE